MLDWIHHKILKLKLDVTLHKNNNTWKHKTLLRVLFLQLCVESQYMETQRCALLAL